MTNITLNKLNNLKIRQEKITCLTAYDASYAHLLSSLGIEVLLVGDSLGMVLKGHASTIPVTIEDIVYHTENVARGNQGAFLIADMPFNSYSTVNQSLKNAGRLMQAGANMIKLEGGGHLVDTIQALTLNSMPVCAHLGLTPQAVNILGGYLVQGKTESAATRIIQDAKMLEQAGAKMLVLECVPSMLAAEITKMLTIPVIGIGAGPACDAQILVLHDLLGVTPNLSPKFAKNFLVGQVDGISGAIKAFIREVKSGDFPGQEHSF